MLGIRGLEELLQQQPALRIEPVTDDYVWVTGNYRLDVIHSAAGRVTRDYKLRICVPRQFPHDYPVVFEVGGDIPNHPDWHVNTHDETLCLGSHLGLELELKRRPHLADFLSATLDPFLYAVTVKMETGRPFVFGELRHGDAGVVQDLAERLRIPESAVPDAFALLAEPDEIARLHKCPCGCGRGLADCETYQRFCAIRNLEGPAWFARMSVQLTTD
jgi:hypothetical protein